MTVKSQKKQIKQAMVVCQYSNSPSAPCHCTYSEWENNLKRKGLVK